MQKISAGKFHFEPPSPFTSFDHLVGAGKQRGRHGDAERFRGLEVDHQLELSRPLHGQVGWLFALENAASVDPGKVIRSGQTWSVTHQAAVRSEISPLKDCRYRMARLERDELCAPVTEERVRGN